MRYLPFGGQRRFIAPPVALWYAKIRHGDLREEMQQAAKRLAEPAIVAATVEV